MYLKASLPPPIPLLPGSRDTSRHQTPALLSTPWPCRTAGMQCSHCSRAVLRSSTLELQLQQHHPCSEHRLSAPGAPWIRVSPFLPHCRPRACKSGSRSASLHLFFGFFFFLLPSIFLKLLDSVFYNEVTCMANSINASQTGPVRNAPPGYTCTFHLRSRGCEWPSPRAP